MTFIKFCGMTRDDDVRLACDLGVDALGFVLWPNSPRSVDAVRMAALVRLLPSRVTPVAVLVSPGADAVSAARDAGARVVQVHGSAPPIRDDSELWIATSLDADISAHPLSVMMVLDAHDPVRHGGTGRTIDWQRAARVASGRKMLLAGGLTAANVGDAIRQVRPFGVDVASGIEERPGIKSAAAMTSFIAAVREADHT
jgi:phosphoribosylanthranilate isomerase